MSRSKWKRRKWLLKNLTFLQLLKYIFLKKPIVQAENLKTYDVEPYSINKTMKVSRSATILVKPSGLRKLSIVVKEMHKLEIEIVKGIWIKDYRKYAKSVFYMVPLEEQNVWFSILEQNYEEGNQALLLYTDSDIARMEEIKKSIRKKMGIQFFKVQGKGKTYITSLTPVHSSTLEEKAYEECVIRHMLKDNIAEEFDLKKIL